MAQSALHDHRRAGSAGPERSLRSFLLFYATMVVAPGLLAVLLLQTGEHLASVPDVASSATRGPLAEGSMTSSFLLAIVVIIATAQLTGRLFERLRQPAVIGEIVGGIMLGPSVLGLVWPDASALLFPPAVLPYIDMLAQLGLILFMFLVGLELPIALVKRRGHAAVAVSHASITIPFVLGIALALWLFPEFASPGTSYLSFALFLGLSMSITAFPVLARILVARRLQQTPLGALCLTCAGVDDVTAWCLLAAVVAIVSNTSPASALITAGLSVAFFVFMLKVTRPMLARLANQHESGRLSSGALLAIVLTGTLLSALATEQIGIHSIFGAFLFGAIMPRNSAAVHQLTGKLEEFTIAFLLPLFFVHIGLQTRVGLLGNDAYLWTICALICAVAVLGKWLGSSVAARSVGLPWRESAALGVLMNCRGLTELVILNIGLELQILTPILFTMLVIMALVTTLMTTPLLDLIRPSGLANDSVPAGDATRTLERLPVLEPETVTDERRG